MTNTNHIERIPITVKAVRLELTYLQRHTLCWALDEMPTRNNADARITRTLFRALAGQWEREWSRIKRENPSPEGDKRRPEHDQIFRVTIKREAAISLLDFCERAIGAKVPTPQGEQKMLSNTGERVMLDVIDQLEGKGPEDITVEDEPDSSTEPPTARPPN